MNYRTPETSFPTPRDPAGLFESAEAREAALARAKLIGECKKEAGALKNSCEETRDNAELLAAATLGNTLDKLFDKNMAHDGIPTAAEGEYDAAYARLRVATLLELQSIGGQVGFAEAARILEAQLQKITTDNGKGPAIELPALRRLGLTPLNLELRSAPDATAATQILQDRLASQVTRLQSLAELAKKQAGGTLPEFQALPAGSPYRLAVEGIAGEIRNALAETTGRGQLTHAEFGAVWEGWHKSLPAEMAASLPKELEDYDALKKSVGVDDAKIESTQKWLEEHGLPADTAAALRELAAHNLVKIDAAVGKAQRAHDSNQYGVKISDGDLGLYLFTTILQFGIPINIMAGEWGGAATLAAIGAGATEMVHPGSLGKMAESIGLKKTAPELRLREAAAKLNPKAQDWLRELKYEDLNQAPQLRSYLRDPNHASLTSAALIEMLRKTEENEKWTRRLPGYPGSRAGNELPAEITATEADAKAATELFQTLQYCLENQIDPKTAAPRD